MSYLAGIYRDYDEKGILPEGGTYSDNTYKWWEIFAVIKMIQSSWVKKAEKAAKMKAKKKR